MQETLEKASGKTSDVTDTARAIIDAEMETSKESAFIHFLSGFFLSIIGLLIAVCYKPKPKADKFIEKSQEYAYVYSKEYPEQKRRKNIKYAFIGAVLSFFLGLGLELFDIFKDFQM